MMRGYNRQALHTADGTAPPPGTVTGFLRTTWEGMLLEVLVSSPSTSASLPGRP